MEEHGLGFEVDLDTLSHARDHLDGNLLAIVALGADDELMGPRAQGSAKREVTSRPAVDSDPRLLGLADDLELASLGHREDQFTGGDRSRGEPILELGHPTDSCSWRR